RRRAPRRASRVVRARPISLRDLPASARVLMSLHYERGLTQPTICRLTGLSTSALRVRLFRARGELQELAGAG
ncbi:MAG: sigma-70 family RNA polymerase sigma factor, partial [Planctomycetes bacterium]|nr:sigma-70 family RNA polymerase sigma factor [Planctomycetota bacterium]